MLNKIFLILLGVAIIVAAVLMYFSRSWLQSITNPVDIRQNYLFYNNLYWSFLWLASLVLLIVGNVILWKQRKSWALWVSFAYLAIFVLLQTWWIGAEFFDFKTRNGLTDNSFSLGGVFGVLICILVAVVVFFDQFIVLRMRDRISGNSELALENKNSDYLTNGKIKSKSED